MNFPTSYVCVYVLFVFVCLFACVVCVLVYHDGYDDVQGGVHCYDRVSGGAYTD